MVRAAHVGQELGFRLPPGDHQETSRVAPILEQFKAGKPRPLIDGSQAILKGALERCFAARWNGDLANANIRIVCSTAHRQLILLASSLGERNAEKVGQAG